jgi:hypothetical protein
MHTREVQMQTEAYNALLDVSVAHDQLSCHKTSPIDSLLAVIRAHRLERAIGLRLLHKHHELQASEVMIEDAVVDKAGFALITRATELSKAGDDWVANSWMLCNDGFVAFEHSRKQLLRDPSISPASHPEFFTAFAQELIRTGTAGLLAPALTSSSKVEGLRPQEHDVMIETTALDDRANVLRFARAEEANGPSSVQTFWLASTPPAPSPTEDNPMRPDTVQPTRVCTRFCPYVQDPPVHQGTYIHRQS